MLKKNIYELGYAFNTTEKKNNGGKRVVFPGIQYTPM